MFNRLGTFRNRAALRVQAKQAADFEAKVKEQYEDIKSNVEDDGYRGYWVAIIMFIGPDSKKAVEANGYFPKNLAARSRHKLAPLANTMRYNQVLVTALDKAGMLDKNSALYEYAASDIDDALARKHEDWNVAAAEQYIKELAGPANRALEVAIKSRQNAIDHFNKSEVLENLSPEGLQDAYSLGFFGMGEKITEEQQRSLDNYKDTGYEGLNKGLRVTAKSKAGALTYHQSRMMEQIDAALRQFTTAKDLKVQRGIKFGDDKGFRQFTKALGGFKKGTVIEDKGFVSTTLRNSIADDFARDSSTRVSVRLDIDVPKGSNAAPIGAFLHAKGERNEPDSEGEILLPRNSRFEIVEYTKPNPADDPQVAYLRMRLVPKAETVNKTQAKLMETAVKKPANPPPVKQPAKKGKPAKKNKFVYDAEDAMSLKVVSKPQGKPQNG